MAITVSTAFKEGLRGPVDISGFKVQVNFVGAIWVDLTDLVEGTIRGRLEESPVGGNFSSNYCFVTFNNDDGAFSPLNTSSPYYNYLTPNKPIVIDVLVNGESCRIFTGVTGAWPPQARSRQVTVKCYDKARIWAKSDILDELVYNEANPGTGLSWNRVFERAAWLAGLRWDWVQTYDTSGTYAATSQLNPDGSSTAITVTGGATTTAVYRKGGSGGTIVMKVDIARSAAGAVLMLKATNVSGKVLKVLSDLAMVIDGRIYFDQQGILRVRSRMYVADPAFSETITIDDLDDCQFTQNYEGSAYPLYNAAKIQAKPLSFRVDADLALVEEPVSFLGDKFPYREFSGGQTFPGATDGQQFASLPDGIFILKTTGYPTADKFRIRSALKDDLLNDLGANGIVWAAGYPKFGTNRVELKLTNNNAKTAVLTELTLSAKLAAPRVVITAKNKDQTSIDQYGQTDFNYQNDFIPDNLAAENLAKWVITSCKDVKPIVTLPLCYATPWTELGDCWRVSETTASIMPTPTDMVIRAFEFALGKDSYTITPEVVPPAPAFVLQAAPGSIQETSNAAAGAKGDEVPYGAVSGVGKQIGLNTVTSVQDILNSTRKCSTTLVAEKLNGSCFYAGYVWCVSDKGYLHKFDPLSMTYVGAWAVGAPTAYYSCTVLGKYLFAENSGGGIVWIDLSALPAVGTALTLNTHYGFKSLIAGYGADKKLVRVGNKLYYVALDGSNRPVIQRIDLSTTTQVTAAEQTWALTTGTPSGPEGAGVAYDGSLVWAGAVYSRVASPPTLTATAAAGASTITVSSATGLAAGQWIVVFGDGGDATKDEFVQITNIAGTTLTLNSSLVNSHASGNGVGVYATTLTKIDPASATPTTIELLDGYKLLDLVFAGRYLFAVFMNRVVRYRVDGGNVTLDKAVPLPNPGQSTYFLSTLFDGTYAWILRTKYIHQIEPRMGDIVATYPTDSFINGSGCFTGLSVIACGVSSIGPYASIWQVPRYSSQAN